MIGQRTRRIALAALAAALVAPLLWAGSDRLEQNDDFCNACHLGSGTPLHIAIRGDFGRIPPVSLAAAHGSVPIDGRPFRCIDCHGGASLPGRVRVKTLAARDLLWYVVGHFGEPTEMQSPLWDEDCQRCHPGFDEPASEAWETPRFHELPVHNVELGIACVACHGSHTDDGAPEAHFLSTSAVRGQCTLCHAEFGQGRLPGLP
jgi:hypothetical protein